MATKKWILSLSAGIISLLAGCGGPNTFNPQNQSGPPSQTSVQISVSTTLPMPPSTLSIISTSLPTLSVTVSNDPDTSAGGAGVNWVLSVCQNSYVNCNPSPCAGDSTTCGYLYLQGDQTQTPITHSSDQATLVYQPPTVFPVPGNNLYVQFLSIAVADPTKNSINTVQVSGFGTVLQAGTYVFHADGGSLPYQIAGAITLDGNGNVTAGHQSLNINGISEDEDSTLVNPDVAQPSCTQNPAPPSCYYFYGSGYFVGADGRGSLILGNMDQAGSLATETFGLIVLSNTKALISELDSNSSVGTLELQSATAAAALPTGAYAFVAGGADPGANPFAVGGVLNVDNNPTPGSISGKGSLAEQDYYSVGTTDCSSPKGLAGNVAPLAGPISGVVIFTFTSSICNAGGSFSPTQFTGYIVDAIHIQLIETDNNYFTAGPAVAQGSAAGTFSLGSFSGQYVFGILGTAPVSGLPFSFTSAGVICPDGSGTLNTNASCAYTSANNVTTYGGYTDTIFLADNGTLPGGLNSTCPYPFSACPGAISGGLSGTYQIDADGIGSIHLVGVKFNPPPGTGLNYFPHPDVHFYLTGQGPGEPTALVLYAEIGLSQYYPAVGVGIAYPQQQPASGLSFGSPETYGVSFTQQNPGSGVIENDGTGWVIANPPSTSALPSCLASQGITSPSLLEGCVDEFVSTPSVGFGAPTPLIDTFTAPADSFGRIAGSFLTLLNTSSPALDAAGEYYFVSPDQGFFVENDLLSPNNITNGTEQVGFAYFAKGCDVTGRDPNLPCASSAASSSGKPVAKRPAGHTDPKPKN